LHDIVAIRIEVLNDRQIGDTALAASPGQHRNNINGLGDQGAGHGHNRLLYKLLEPSQRSDRGAGVDGTDATWMACPSRLEQV
jgi:hypothetical protein